MLLTEAENWKYSIKISRERRAGRLLIQLREVSSQNRISNSQVLVPDAVKLRISNW